MKKSINKELTKLSVAFLAMFFYGINVYAADKCTYQEQADLNDAARRVRTSYEVVERMESQEWSDGGSGKTITEEIGVNEFKISIYNITDDIYITQTNSTTKKTLNIYAHMATNGVYTFIDKDIDNISIYSYRIFSNAEGCKGQSLRSYTIKKPMFNVYSNYSICEGLQDIPYCKPYITEMFNVYEPELKTAIETYLSDRRIPIPGEEKTKTFWGWVKDNYGYIIIGGLLIAAASGGAYYIIKKRRTI